MFNIEKFLEKFGKNLRSAEEDKQRILEIVEKHTHIKIPVEQVEIKNFVLNLHGSAAVSNRVFIGKSKILEEIAHSTSVKIVDIK